MRVKIHGIGPLAGGWETDALARAVLHQYASCATDASAMLSPNGWLTRSQVSRKQCGIPPG
eukprot:1685803-Prorocentrum_lima.AAC.1